MKQLFEYGEEVLFSTGENGRKSNIGMILKYKEDTDEYTVLSVYNSAYKNIRTVWIEPISNVGKIRDSIKKYWEGQIKEQEKYKNEIMEIFKHSYDVNIIITDMRDLFLSDDKIFIIPIKDKSGDSIKVVFIDE